MNRIARTAAAVDNLKRRTSDGEYLKKENNNPSRENNNNSELKNVNKNNNNENSDENDDFTTVEFINVCYGYKRRITLNPLSTVQHMRKFLDDRIKLDYLDDFSLAVAEQQFKENLIEKDNNSLDPNSNKNRRNRRNHRKSTSSDISRTSSPKIDDLPKNIEELPRVSYEEALESIKLQQTIKVDKRWLGLKKDEDLDEENEDFEEILGFLTSEGECIQAFSYDHTKFLKVLNNANTLKYQESGGKLTRDNNNFFLAIMRLVAGEVTAITPLFLHPTRLVELLPACRDWLRQYTVNSKKKKDMLAKQQQKQEIKKKR